MRRAAIVILALFASIGSAHADEARPAAKPISPPPANALSLQLVALLGQGLTVQYERQATQYVSFATALGRRWSGGDAFDTTETSFGVEGRYWILGRVPGTRWSGRGMIGPYVGFRVDGALTHVREGDRLVGSTVGVAQALFLGGRVVFLDRIEVTPSVGFGIREEMDPRGRLPTIVRPEWIRFGLTAGVVF